MLVYVGLSVPSCRSACHRRYRRTEVDPFDLERVEQAWRELVASCLVEDQGDDPFPMIGSNQSHGGGMAQSA